MSLSKAATATFASDSSARTSKASLPPSSKLPESSKNVRVATSSTTKLSMLLILIFFAADSFLGSAHVLPSWASLGSRLLDLLRFSNFDSLDSMLTVIFLTLVIIHLIFRRTSNKNNKVRSSPSLDKSAPIRKKKPNVTVERRQQNASGKTSVDYTLETALARWRHAIYAAAQEGDADKAGKVLIEFEEQSKGNGVPKPDAVCYNIVIRAYCKHADLKNAELWLHRMESRSVDATVCSYNTILDASAKVEKVEACEAWFREMLHKGVQPNSISYATVIHARARRGDERAAEKWLKEMLEAGVEPDAVCYNSMIHACSANGNASGAERWIEELQSRGLEASVTTFTTVIDTCAKALDVPRAEKWLEAMIAAGVQPNVVTFSAMIDACAKAGDLTRAEYWHDRMVQYGIEPNAFAYSAVINACAKAGKVGKSECWLARAEKAGVANDAVLYSSVIDACAKVGDAERAMEVFEQMLANGVRPHIVAYAALARPFSHKGDWQAVERIAEQMAASGMKPNEYFIYAQLIAYATGKPKQLARAEDYFRNALRSGYKINDHVISALCRAVGRQHCTNLMNELCGGRPVPPPPAKAHRAR